MTVDCRANLQPQQFSLSQTAANDLNYWSIQTCKKKEKEGVFSLLFFFRPSLTCLTNAHTHLAVLRGRDQPAEKDWLVQNELGCSGKLGISAL